MFDIIANMAKGYIGEKRTQNINDEIKKKLGKEYQLVFLDGVTLEKARQVNNIPTTQIDHIVFSKKTNQIFIVESKNYNREGDVFGDVKEKTWQCHYGNIEKYPLNNPLFQAYGQMKTIQEIIKQETGIFVPQNNFEILVYFNGNTRFNLTDSKKDNRLFNLENVVFRKKDYIERFKSKLENGCLYKAVDMDTIIDLIDKKNLTDGLNIKSFIEKRKHNQHIRKQFGK